MSVPTLFCLQELVPSESIKYMSVNFFLFLVLPDQHLPTHYILFLINIMCKDIS